MQFLTVELYESEQNFNQKAKIQIAIKKISIASVT